MHASAPMSHSSRPLHGPRQADWPRMQLIELMSDRASPSPDSVLSCCADLLQLTVWLTPAGTVDEGGVEQPAYLNFDAALLGRPSNNEMEVGLLCHSVPAQS